MTPIHNNLLGLGFDSRLSIRFVYIGTISSVFYFYMPYLNQTLASVCTPKSAVLNDLSSRGLD